MKRNNNLLIPTDVPKKKEKEFIKNIEAITRDTGRLMLFSCDQKIEHLNTDFYGPNIHPQAIHTEHLFRIADQGSIGAMATHLGLIARYGKQYANINYIVKLNAKTNLIKTEQKDPISNPLWDVKQTNRLKEESGLNICGIGFTAYIGSEQEHKMLEEAAHAIYEAHQHGLVAILWVYPRGKAVANDRDANLIAGAAGVAASLGADFVKIKPPEPTDVLSSAQALKIATAAAGNTKVICSGGTKKDSKAFLKELHDQIHIGGTAGNATGRNIFQHALPEAVAMTKAISAIVFDNADTKDATDFLDRSMPNSSKTSANVKKKIIAR